MQSKIFLLLLVAMPFVAFAQSKKSKSHASKTTKSRTVKSEKSEFTDATSAPIAAPSDREAVLTSLRTSVKDELHQRDVKLQINEMKILNDWAFVSAKPQQPNGEPIDYDTTPMSAQHSGGGFEDNVVTLLAKENGRWIIKTQIFGATDVPYGCWWAEFGSPRELTKYSNSDCEGIEKQN